jgi:hypothetical protein
MLHSQVTRLRGEASSTALGPERGELSFSFGPDMRAANVVSALLKIIQEVTENGIVIGYEEDNVLVEKIDGSIEMVPTYDQASK